MPITLRQLEIFDKVAACGHVTQASRQLLLTQSAVSMAIAEFERLAGAPLFERQGRRLLLNDRGRLILPQAREVLQNIRKIEQFLDESAAQPKGILQVGASTTIGNYLLPALVGHFSHLYPAATALLKVGNAQQIEEALERGELDIGLSEGLPHLRSLQAEPWRHDELVLVVGPTHAWASRRKATLDMLAGAAWIMRERGSGTREIFEAALAKKGVDCRVALELGHTEAIKKAAEAGLGVGCLSKMAVQRELEHGWLVEIASPLDLHRTLVILRRRSEQSTKLLQAFLALLQQEGDY
ncbi:LysR substrate-binding domain-containing protein [Desulfuromonas sp. KJ2020]|uniref:LysR substrate-binding domain-containing protein n=1 Tax=Desulfuromonas sp. KJ2020 TaxID=2919173 RepID=UPI0020A74B56|nr:LysR substrate-binding domain-containing protein [Desulfuromonas sp. KJ2020]MCP3176727.1 LysR substrate-binding domain-containing protein [Desulfuromonas sp. KJ2020]